MKIKSIFTGAVIATLVAASSASAQDVIGYITKSATNAGWMMINQVAYFKNVI